MSRSAIFVDLSNFYSRLLRSGLGEPLILKEYFLTWLDLDFLADGLTDSYTGVWVFYSGERIGPSGDQRIKGSEFTNYIRRINALKGITARGVNIPGEQREPISYTCSECGYEGLGEAISEKGVDASLTVHLFDTMDAWDTAFLLSGDADFVPAVESLRRRGKIVVGVGFSDASAALVRECYDYVNIIDAYLRQDFLMFLIFRRGGIAYQWLNGDVQLSSDSDPAEKIRFSINWGIRGESAYALGGAYENQTGYLDISYDSKVIVTGRMELLAELKAMFGDCSSIRFSTPGFGQGTYISHLAFSPMQSVARHIDQLLSSLKGIEGDDRDRETLRHLFVEFVFNQKRGRFEISLGPQR